MSLIAASIFVRDVAEVDDALQRAGRAAAGGAGLVEWRVDVLADSEAGWAAIGILVRDSPAPCIVTCRSVTEGGSFTGDRNAYAEILETAARLEPPPRYLDVEFAAWRDEEEVRRIVAEVAARDRAEPGGPSRVLLSAHAVDGRPPDLLQRVEAMNGLEEAAVTKIVWTARSVRDNLEALDLLAERCKPTVALCMGPYGLMSRVLAAKFGGLLTFAAPTGSAGTAPGQPTVAELRERYRFDDIGRDTQVYGVVGWPVEHSRGPDLHNAAFGAVGFDGVYLPLPVPAEYEHFKASIGAMIDHPRLAFRGASVTIPHKTHLVRFVSEAGGRVDALAERIGAANTLIVGGTGAISCLNTDAPALVDALCDGMNVDRGALRGRRIAVFGAGGAARAAVAGLCDAGAAVTVVNRTAARAGELVNELRARLGVDDTMLSAARPETLATGGCEIFINATPVGMHGGPDPEGSPLPDDVPLDHGSTVLDTVYMPATTPLLREAAARGARVIPGTEMFVRQAALQFEAWTGEEAPVETLRKTLKR